MPLTAEQIAEIRKVVWSGSYSPSRLVEIATQELYAPGEIDTAGARQFIEAEISEKARQEANWPVPTDCDRLESLFTRLNQAGLAAVMNAGHTLSNGYEDVDNLCAERGGPGPRCFGYCFFHSQDMHGAQDGGGLYLAFGDFSGEQDKGLAVGRLIVAEARAQGLAVEWDQSFGSRILLTPFNWQKRGMPADTVRSEPPPQPGKGWWRRLFG